MRGGIRSKASGRGLRGREATRVRKVALRGMGQARGCSPCRLLTLVETPRTVSWEAVGLSPFGVPTRAASH
jgi:hypothetical protein